MQFGVTPGSLVVSGLTDDEVRALCSWSRGTGRHRARLAAVLDQVGTESSVSGGLVIVTGRGPLMSRVCDLLRQSGVEARAAPLGPLGWVGLDPFSVAAEDAPTLVVLVDYLTVPAAAGKVWRDLGIPVLPLADHGSRVDVGPLVTPASPCLECVEQYRYERDDAWLAVSEEIATGTRAVPVSADPALSLGAAMAAIVVVGHLAGRQWPPGLSVEVGLPDPDVVHRRWPVHARCTGRHAREAVGA